MPEWLQRWLPTLILPVLVLGWYAFDDRADIRQRIAFLEKAQAAILEEQLEKRMLTLEIQQQATSLSVKNLETTVQLVAAKQFGG